jgi:hypothetical protein
MRLFDRYKRLGLWARVSFWGSIATFVGLVIAFLPSPPTKSASTTGNSSPAIVATGANARISISYSDSPTQNITKDKDDLIVSIPTIMGFEKMSSEELYSDVLFINNGQNDATLESRQLSMLLNRSDALRAGVAWFGIIGWDLSTAAIHLPARKTTSIRFPFRKEFISELRDIFKNPYDFRMMLLCTVIDANGSAHTVHKCVGTFHLTPTNWRTTRSTKEEVSLRLLPSRVTHHTTSAVGPFNSPKDMIKELRNYAEQLDDTE